MALVALDSNLLLLLVVGSASRKYIGMHKRLRAYDESDFDLLLELSVASKIVLTPELPRLGLTDCALLSLCLQGVTLVTAVLKLFLAVVSRGAKALNFNHLRDGRA